MNATARRDVHTRARRLGIAVLLLTFTSLALAEIAKATWARNTAPGELDLSTAFEWPLLLLASLGPAAIVYWGVLRLDRRREPGLDLVDAHESAMQAMVAAKMAIELDDSARAEHMLGQAITCSSSILDSLERS